MKFDLHNIIKALLISTSEPISIAKLQKIFKSYVNDLEEEIKKSSNEEEITPLLEEKKSLPLSLTPNVIRNSIAEINTQLLNTNEPFHILEQKDGYIYAVNPSFAPWIRILRHDVKPLKLSSAALETLAMVAYRQPVTRAEIEMIRGVSSDSLVNKLLDLELIYVKGQADLPGKPRLYATTDKFLDFCGIHSLEELPSSNILSETQLNDAVQAAQKRPLYENQDLGLPN